MHPRSAVAARRVRALTFCAGSVPAALLLPRAGWLWTLAASALSGGLLLLCRRRAARPSRWLDALGLVWTLLALGAAARRLCASFPQQESLAVGLLLLLLAVYASARGEQVLMRTGAVCCLLLAGLFGLLLLFTLPTVHAAWLRPRVQPDWSVLPYALLPLASLSLRPDAPRVVHPGAAPRAVSPRCRNRRALRPAHRQSGHEAIWAGANVLLATLCALTAAGCLSPQVAAATPFAFYEAMKSGSLMGVMEHVEPLVSAALTVGGFALLGLLCAVSARQMQRAAPRLSAHAGLCGLLGGLGGFALAPLLPTACFAVGATIFWGLVPLAELIRGFQK